MAEKAVSVLAQLSDAESLISSCYVLSWLMLVGAEGTEELI